MENNSKHIASKITKVDRCRTVIRQLKSAFKQKEKPVLVKQLKFRREKEFVKDLHFDRMGRNPAWTKGWEKTIMVL